MHLLCTSLSKVYIQKNTTFYYFNSEKASIHSDNERVLLTETAEDVNKNDAKRLSADRLLDKHTASPEKTNVLQNNHSSKKTTANNRGYVNTHTNDGISETPAKDQEAADRDKGCSADEQEYDEAGPFSASDSEGNNESDNESLYDAPSPSKDDTKIKTTSQTNTYDTFNSVRQTHLVESGEEEGEEEEEYDTIEGAGQTSVRSGNSNYSTFEQVRQMGKSQEGENTNKDLDVYDTTLTDKKSSGRAGGINYDKVDLDRSGNFKSGRVIRISKSENTKTGAKRQHSAEIMDKTDCSKKINETEEEERKSVASTVDDENEYSFCEIDETSDHECETNEAIYEECLVEDEEKQLNSDPAKENCKDDKTTNSVSSEPNEPDSSSRDKNKDNRESDRMYDSVEDDANFEQHKDTVDTPVNNDKSDKSKQNDVTADVTKSTKPKTSAERRIHDYEEFDLKF